MDWRIHVPGADGSAPEVLFTTPPLAREQALRGSMRVDLIAAPVFRRNLPLRFMLRGKLLWIFTGLKLLAIISPKDLWSFNPGLINAPQPFAENLFSQGGDVPFIDYVDIKCLECAGYPFYVKLGLDFPAGPDPEYLFEQFGDAWTKCLVLVEQRLLLEPPKPKDFDHTDLSLWTAMKEAATRFFNFWRY